ncbi:MAG: 4Fe-4S binding protein [Phycisphaerae bacterium]|nr:4Fe-4S binding protein [Phycisphaerae bacterium]
MRTRVRPHLRLWVRVACLIAAILCLWPVHARLLPLVGAISPFVAVASLIAVRAFHAVLVLGLIVTLVVLFRHRFFCRWMCPTGLCMDGASNLGRRLKRKPWQGVSTGRWLLALTLGGALIGCPLFLWLDPLALFSGLFTAAAFPHDLAAWFSAFIFAALLIACILSPNLWCGGLCPSGALQDILAHLSRSVRSFRIKNTCHADTGHPVARRTLIGVVLGLGGATIVRGVGGARPRPLRPPGAIDEPTFTSLCTRCGNCLRACPYGIIERDTSGPWTSLLTPTLTFENDYCRQDCTRCTEVCPNGAIARMPLDAKPNAKIGLPRVDMRICLLGEDRECSACRRWCPYEAIRYIFCEENYTLVPVIDPARCNGCGACQAACPTDPLKAIQVLPYD